jgi:outer membrane protein assembly factor BamB
MNWNRLVTSWGSLVFLVTVLLFCDLGSIPAADRTSDQWTHWRGPSFQGYSDDARVPLAWSETHNLLWKTKLEGAGNSSPIVWGERIFLTEARLGGKELWVVCIRTGDGKLLWNKLAARVDAPGKTHEWNGYASPSCTTDGTHVYAFFGTPGLFCYDLDGREVWQHPFGVFTSATGWGVGASPFLFEDLVIQNCDNDGPAALPSGHKPEEAAPMALVALDKKTGDVRWQAKRDQGRGFSTPLLVPHPESGVDLVLNGPHGVWAYDPHTGKELWHCERHRGDENALFGEPLPVFDRETLFATSGRPGPLQAIRLGKGQGNGTQTQVLWDVSRKGSRDVASPLLWGDTLYLADRYGYLTAYDINSGNTRFKERLDPKKPFVASPVAVRGKLLFTSEDGITYVLEPGHSLQKIGSNRLHDGTEFRASPAIADGRIYYRSQAYLYCIGEKK